MHPLVLQNVSKWYAGHRAVDDLSLTVPAGAVYGILGPNGAGKSSTIRAALNIVARDAGEVRVFGEDPGKNPSVLKRVGYLPEERGLYKKMRVLDVIVFFSRLKGIDGRRARSEAEQWLERMGLTEWRGARVEALSKGMQQKVQFIATVLHRPDLVFLDESAAGLDPINQDVFRDAVRELRDEGRTVVFSTHNMNEAEQLCDRVCIISRGRKVLDGSIDSIRKAHRGNRWRIEFEDTARGVVEMFADNGRFQNTAVVPNGWDVTLPDEESPRKLLTALVEMDQIPQRFERVSPSLHEIFVSHVRAHAHGGGEEVNHA